MTLSEDGFSSMQNPATFVVYNPLQIKETGFHPKFDTSLEHQDQAPKNDDLEEEVNAPSDEPNEKIADAYTQGYLNGQQAAMVQDDENQQVQDALAAAMNRLVIIDETKLEKQFWEAVLSLFNQAVGNAKIDKQLMQQRCSAALEMIGQDLSEACLHVAPSDAKILQDYDCKVPIIAAPELLPGSVQLLYAAGEIRSGTLSMSQEIESRISLAGGDPC